MDCKYPIANCPSNMSQIGKAIKSYLADYDDHFPTNRLPNGEMHYEVQLSPNEYDAVYAYGVNWVEALYPYVDKVGRPGDFYDVFKCNNTRYGIDPNTSTENASVTYVMNYNLLEQPAGSVRNPDCTMLLRETGFLVDAICRPTVKSTTAKTPPVNAFLTKNDSGYRKPQSNLRYRLHGEGSNILFADGHVKVMQSALFPENWIDSKRWDATTKQWWNSLEPGKKIICLNP